VFTLAFAASRAWTTSKWPSCEATNNAVMPLAILVFRSAFAASSALTRERSPAWAALRRSSSAWRRGGSVMSTSPHTLVRLNTAKVASIPATDRV
jgi:hypothetical protein